MNDGIYNQKGMQKYVRDFLKACEVYSWFGDVSREILEMRKHGETAAGFTVRGNKVSAEKLVRLASSFQKDFPVYSTAFYRRPEAEVREATKKLRKFMAKVEEIMAEDI